MAPLLASSFTVGLATAAPTAIVALVVAPPSPPSIALVDACVVKLPLPPPVGVNLRPALPWAKVMKSPLTIAVEPLFRNRLPLVMPVILKWVTSVLSAAFRVSTNPLVVWVAGTVLAPVTAGVSATAATAKETVSLAEESALPIETAEVMACMPSPSATNTLPFNNTVFQDCPGVFATDPCKVGESGLLISTI